MGPSYKRGPPKGYIHAIEQRWHQVEALLGSVLQCPDEGVQRFVADLKQDDLAREILGRVDAGPYGPAGRRAQPADATKEDFFASILKSNASSTNADPSRSRRQSRVSREIVSSNQDHGLSVVPTREWQDNLSKRLAHHPGPSSRLTDLGGEPIPQKRRLNNNNPQLFNNLYTMEPSDDSDNFESTTEGMGLLSLDENQEVRFHGRVSGLDLLGRNERTDDRIDGGIWRLPMARVWPPTRFGLEQSQICQTHVELPPQDVQDKLIELYFTNVHPVFPVIHKPRFFSEYQSKMYSQDFKDSPNTELSSVHSSPKPEPTQEVTPLLLLSIFTISARFTDDDKPLDGRMWEAGCDYLATARQILGGPSSFESFNVQ